MNQKGLAPILILIAALIIFVTAGGFYLLGKSQSTNPETTSTQPSPTPDETANWKIYTNTKYSYTIKYPSNWSLVEPSMEYVDVYDKPNIKEPELHDGTWLTINISNKWEGIPLDAPIGTSLSNIEGVVNEKISDIQISNYTGAKFIQTVQNSPTNARPTIRMVLKQNDKFLVFSFSALNQEQLDKDSVIFDKIISTFKFTNETNSTSDFCGGIAGITCSSGYSCKLDGTYPDAGGKCIKN